MDQSATHMIREDHRKVAQLYHRYQGMGGQAAEKRALAEQICHELEVHAAIEEGIFYPAVRAALGTDSDELVDEALKEHGEMKKLIDKVRAGAVDDPAGGQLMQTLMQNVQHQVQEEESRMLP